MRVFLLLIACAVMAQTPAHYVAIHIPDGVASEKMFIRYILESEETGGVVNARPGVTDYLISTGRGDHSAARFKAVVYAPDSDGKGCAIQTIDVQLSDDSSAREQFVCVPVPNAAISGRLMEPARLGGREVRLQAVYVARWAQSFLGISPLTVDIPLGDAADIDADGRFRLTVPELRSDDAEIELRAIDKSTGANVAQIVPVGDPQVRTRMGGLKVQNRYPEETAFLPCTLGPHTLTLIDRQKSGWLDDDHCAR